MLIRDVTFRRLAALLHTTQMAALGIVIVAVLALWRLADGVQAADAAIQETHRVIDELGNARRAIQRAQVALRQFGLSGESEDLDEVHAACQRAMASMDRLQVFAVSHAADRTFVNLAAREMREAVGWLDNAAVAGGIDGTEPVQRIPRARAGMRDMEGLRFALDAVADEQEALLFDRVATQDRRMADLKAAGALAAALLALLSLWSIAYARRLMRIGSAMIDGLRSDAERDPLTGLLNRRGLARRVAGLPAQSRFTVLHARHE